MENRKLLLDSIQQLSQELQQKLYLIGIEIEDNFIHIKSSKSYEEANQYFDCLQEIQVVLSGLIFKNKIKVPDFMWNFVTEFDRLDDDDLRKYMYKEIKEGCYLFNRQ